MAKANNKELENFIKNSLDVRISANRDYVDDNYINITVKLFIALMPRKGNHLQ